MRSGVKKDLAYLVRRRMEAEYARRTLAGFISYTKRDYVHTNFSRTVCTALDEFLISAHEGRRPVLVLQAPPQHGKSEIVSRRLPPYIFGRWPDTRLAACSYAADLARDMNRDVQRIMQTTEYREVFPETWLNPKRVVTIEGQALRNSERFDIVGNKGYYICSGVGGPLTGKSVDIGIIDDPIKNQKEALSDTIKKNIRGWYETVFLTRLSKSAGQIIMATSWAVDDLAGTILKTDPKAKHLKFAAIDENGNALVPELHPLEKLLDWKSKLSPSFWSAMYMQNPVVEGGNIIEEAWMRTWTERDLPPMWDELIQSWDLAFKDTMSSSFVVGQVWARKGANFYLLHQNRARLSFTKTVDAIVEMSCLYPGTIAKLVEDKANGPAVIDRLKNEIPGLIPITPDGSKVARAHAVTPLWRSGNVYIPANAPWVKDFRLELVQFPLGSHNDQVDAMTQALSYFFTSNLSIWEALGK